MLSHQLEISMSGYSHTPSWHSILSFVEAWEKIIVLQNVTRHCNRIHQKRQSTTTFFFCKSKPPTHLLPHEWISKKQWGDTIAIHCNIGCFGIDGFLGNSVCCCVFEPPSYYFCHVYKNGTMMDCRANEPITANKPTKANCFVETLEACTLEYYSSIKISEWYFLICIDRCGCNNQRGSCHICVDRSSCNNQLVVNDMMI